MGSGPSTEDIGEQLEKLKADLEKENNDLSKLIERTVQKLNSLKNVTLDIAITGEAGAGKSSLVNALRGVEDYEEANDILLAEEIHKMKRNFYYVRTKLDVDIKSERRQGNFSEEKTLEKIRKYCCDNLAKAGEFHPKVFLVSSRNRRRYDFQVLLEVMGNELDEIKRYVLLTTLSNDSKEILKKKKAAMEALVEKVALVSSTTGAAQVPGLSIVCNIQFLKEKMRDFSMIFGLDEYSLQQLAKKVGKPDPVLSSAIQKTRIASQINNEFVKTLLSKMCKYEGRSVWESILYAIPGLSSRRADSFQAISQMLQRFLDDAEEDAVRVLAKAVEN
ncbi:UNVERIFIED_CONTAM: hypothetical protein K2H54_038549 [Gekko kuhli]